MKEEIRSIYAELQGYLAQIPETVGHSDWTSDRVLWTQLNFIVGELNRISSKDYNRFKITPDHHRVTKHSTPYETIPYSTYRANLGGLIAKLHAEYFSDEEPPFRTMPSTVITQNQTQSQSVSLLLDIQEKIISEIPKHEEGSKERTFLEKIKSVLPSLKTGVDIISNILKIGADSGLTAGTIHKLLHL